MACEDRRHLHSPQRMHRLQAARHAVREEVGLAMRGAHMMVQALLPGCSTMQEATNHRDARRSKEPPPVSDPSRQYVAPAPLIFSGKLARDVQAHLQNNPLHTVPVNQARTLRTSS